MTKFGYYLPWVLTGAVLMCVGNGLFSLWPPTTTTDQWVINPLLSIGQSLGGAVFVPVGNTILYGSLSERLTVRAPAVDQNLVLAAGATAFRDVVSPAALPGVLLAFSDSIDGVFYMTAALAALTFIVAYGMAGTTFARRMAGRNSRTDRLQAELLG